MGVVTFLGEPGEHVLLHAAERGVTLQLTLKGDAKGVMSVANARHASCPSSSDQRGAATSTDPG